MMSSYFFLYHSCLTLYALWSVVLTTTAYPLHAFGFADQCLIPKRHNRVLDKAKVNHRRSHFTNWSLSHLCHIYHLFPLHINYLSETGRSRIWQGISPKKIFPIFNNPHSSSFWNYFEDFSQLEPSTITLIATFDLCCPIETAFYSRDREPSCCDRLIGPNQTRERLKSTFVSQFLTTPTVKLVGMVSGSCSLDAVTPHWHFIPKSLNNSLISFCCLFLH